MMTKDGIQSTTKIPLFLKEDLKKDFNKLLKMNGPRYQNPNTSKSVSFIKTFSDRFSPEAMKLEET